MFLPKQPGRVALVDRRIEHAVAAAVFVTQIDVRRVRANRMARDRDAFEQLVRILLHQDAVVERARLALVGVDAQVNRPRMILRQEGPLQPAEKPAPPRPRRPESFTSFVTSSGAIASAFFSAS